MRSLRNGNTRLDRDGDGIPCESICKMRGSSSSSTATRQDGSPGARPRQSRPAVAAVRGPARLISVGDGDTSRVMASHGHTVTVRLACIDAPETAQGESGSQATLHLKRMVAQGPLELRPQTVDRYGRIVAEVIADGRNVNLEMVRAGMAYVPIADTSAAATRAPTWVLNAWPSSANLAFGAWAAVCRGHGISERIADGLGSIGSRPGTFLQALADG